MVKRRICEHETIDAAYAWAKIDRRACQVIK
ncbi:hypothetical protein F4560_008731 [Saccharothrix ecbatanensis]|uniref:Transposase n=1 Tax=Saccharothrix ecbatanensis TaxID=1105145 RepID=A0A7W9M6D8_9PSEU|nr:hypothetical protein [Saccharothrix ecbatanensis]